MKVITFDTKTGNAAGEWEIPDEIISAAFVVYDWMRANDVSQLAGLGISEQPPELCRRRRVIPQREQPGG